MFRSFVKLQSLVLWVMLVASTVSGQSGNALCQNWWNQDGSTIADLDTSKPSDASLITTLDRPKYIADDYGTRIECLFKPTVTGAHSFMISGDDYCELWLSTDQSAANLVRICHVPGWSSYMQIDKYPEQTSAAITLTAGQSYYLRVLHKEGHSSDHVTVQFEAPGIARQIVDAAHISIPTETNAPTTPGNLAKTGGSDRVVRLSWDMSSDDTAVASYEIVRDGTHLSSVSASNISYEDGAVQGSTTYSYQVYAKDVFGNSSPVSASLSVTTEAPVPDSDGDGLSACYYNDYGYTQLALTRIDSTIDFDWGYESPAPEVNRDFSVVWDGCVTPRYSEIYDFRTFSDDGVRLYVNNKLIIDNWGLHSVTENIGTIALEAGKKYPIRMEFFDKTANATARLLWSAESQPLEVIPRSQLHSNPYFGETAATLLTTDTSYVSPAWVEGKVGTAIGDVTATVNGAAFSVTRLGSMSFCLTSGGASPGIALDAATPTAISVVAGTTTLTQSITWLPTLLNDGGSKIIRKNDSLLLGVSAAGTTLEIDVNYDSEVGFTTDYTGATTTRFTHCFSTAGTFNVAARVDGTIVGQLALTVVGVDFQGPVACELGFKRIKDVAIAPVDAVASVSFASVSPQQVQVNYVETIATGTRIDIKPLEFGWGVEDATRNEAWDLVIARLGEGGPALALQQVDTFEMYPQDSKYIGVVQQYEDGSMLVETKMLMTKQIPDLVVDLHIFVTGVTFPDSTMDMSLNTSNFTYDAGLSTYVHPYQLIAQPGISTGTCHTIKIYQNGVQVGQ